MRVEDRIKAMIRKQLIDRGISDEYVLEAFLNVQRQLFVPDDLEHLAYQDGPLNIGYGQTISQPFTVAYMMSLLTLAPSDIVLEIGTGSGYQTALLAEIVKKVYTIERIAPLAKKAAQTLENMGYKNIEFYVGDGTKGWYDTTMKFDKIIVTAGAPVIPKALIEQLKLGGKLVIPVGDRNMQTMQLLIKKSNKIEEYDFDRFAFVPLIGKDGWKL